MRVCCMCVVYWTAVGVRRNFCRKIIFCTAANSNSSSCSQIESLTLFSLTSGSWHRNLVVCLVLPLLSVSTPRLNVSANSHRYFWLLNSLSLFLLVDFVVGWHVWCCMWRRKEQQTDWIESLIMSVGGVVHVFRFHPHCLPCLIGNCFRVLIFIIWSFLSLSLFLLKFCLNFFLSSPTSLASGTQQHNTYRVIERERKREPVSQSL